jgi:uncharacterized membrane protein YjjP (DUF1212 family)
MKRQEAERALTAAMYTGELILECGGEVSRVEDSIKRICTAYGADRTDVFCITASIITTLYYGKGESVTQTRRIVSAGNDFDKLSRVNDLSRTIVRTCPDPSYVLERLREIQDLPSYSFRFQLLIYALISASFTVFFGGSARDAMAAGLIGILLRILERRLLKEHFNKLFTALFCSLAGGFLAFLLVHLGLGENASMISIGNIMLFIPGVKFTNSIRDLFMGETITGLICLAESILQAAVVALGFASASLIL